MVPSVVRDAKCGVQSHLLTFDAPISSHSTAYDKAKRRVSTRGTTFSPLQAFKTRRVRHALSQSQSRSQNAPHATAPAGPASGTVPAKDSRLFTLPIHIRDRIYQFVIVLPMPAVEPCTSSSSTPSSPIDPRQHTASAVLTAAFLVFR
jgi:hypothetical protein